MTAQKYQAGDEIVEAWQWDGTAEGASPIIDWILTGDRSARYHDKADNVPGAETEIAIDLPAGVTVKAKPEDWVVRDGEGFFFPLPSGIFAATYEAVQA